jgi:hypothetical protein
MSSASRHIPRPRWCRRDTAPLSWVAPSERHPHTLPCVAPTLAYPDFNRSFILYTDGSHERGFGVALHQLDADGIERPILYLSKALTPAEWNYWPTELETGALVWALQKLPQFQAIRDAFHDQGPLTPLQ